METDQAIAIITSLQGQAQESADALKLALDIIQGTKITQLAELEKAKSDLIESASQIDSLTEQISQANAQLAVADVLPE